MSNDYIIRPLERQDCKAIARMHNRLMPQTSMAMLGDAFTELVYLTIADSKNAFCFVAVSGDTIAGFACATTSITAFKKEFKKKYCFKASLQVLKKALNFKVIQILLKLSSVTKSITGLPDAEFISLAVDPDYRKTGLTFTFFNKIRSEFKRRGVNACRLSIHESYKDLQRVYEILGAKFFGEVAITKDIRWREYTWTF